MVHKNDGITRVKVGGNTYELKLGDKTKDGYDKIKVLDGKNYILLTYLARDLAGCVVVWEEALQEICVVKGEYLGNGLVKGPSDYLMKSIRACEYCCAGFVCPMGTIYHSNPCTSWAERYISVGVWTPTEIYMESNCIQLEEITAKTH